MHILHVRTLGDKKQYFFFLQEIVFNFLLGDPTGVDEIAYSFKLEAYFFFNNRKHIISSEISTQLPRMATTGLVTEY